jgi:hypothetical protein
MLGLGRNFAETAQAHEDARLRGRTYAIPFEDVWNAALALASVGQRGWRVVRSDDEEGVINAVARTMRGRTDDIVIRVSLDEDAQTRVDARAVARQGRTDWGRNARRLRRFFRALDSAVVETKRQRLESKRGARGTAVA